MEVLSPIRFDIHPSSKPLGYYQNGKNGFQYRNYKIDVANQLYNEIRNLIHQEWFKQLPEYQSLHDRLVSIVNRALSYDLSDAEYAQLYADYQGILSEISQYQGAEIDYARSLPENVASQMEAAGLSRGAALQNLGAPSSDSAITPSQFVGGAPTRSQQFHEMFSDICNGLVTAASFTQMGLSLPDIFARNVVSSNAASLSDMDLEGAVVANKFHELLGHAQQTDVYKQNPGKYQSVSDIEQLFRDLSTNGVETDTAYGQFVNDYVNSGITQKPYVRSRLFGANELQSTNNGFAERMNNMTILSGFDAKQAAQDLINSKEQFHVIHAEHGKKLAEIQLLGQDYENAIKQGVLLETQNRYYDARTGYVYRQTEFQKLLNRAQKCDTIYKEATTEKLTEFDLEQLKKSIARVQAAGPDGVSIQLQTELNNDYTAYLWSCIANDGAVNAQEYWSANPQMRDLYVSYSDPVIQNGMRSVALQSDIESKTQRFGLDFGVLKFERERVAPIASYLSILNARSNAGSLTRTIEAGDAVLNAQGEYTDFWKGKSDDFFAPQPWQTQPQK